MPTRRATTSLRPSHRCLVVAAIGLSLAACQSEATGPEDPGPGDDGFAVCAAVSFARTSGLPFDEVAVGRLPDDFEEPYAGELLADDGSTVGFALVSLDGSGNARLTVPVHPATPLEGGSVQLALTDGSVRCAPVDFTIDPLPEADGEVAALLEWLSGIMREQAALLGITPEELVAADPEDLPLVYHPLALVHGMLEHPDNEYSLLAILEGTSPLSDPDALALADRIFARLGVGESLGGSAPTATAATRTSKVDDAGSECTPGYIGGSAQRLDDCMALALSLTLSATGAADEVLDDISTALAALGLVPHPGLQLGTAVAALAIFVLQNERNKMAGLLPSSLTNMTVDFGQTTFKEDEEGPGGWSNAEVMATNDGWDMGMEAIEAALALAGHSRALERFVGQETVNDVLVLVFTQVGTWFLDGATLDEFQIDPVPFGPVDVTGADWTEARVAQGDAVELTAHQIFELKKVGVATISVRTEDGRFGGQQVAEAGEITVEQLDLDIDPAEIVVEPGEVVFFNVTVDNSAYPAEVALVEGMDLQGEAEISFDGESTHTISYTAPQSPNPTDPDVISVRHTTTHGARGGDAPPRTASATVRFGGIRITTEPRCIELGEPPIPIDIEIAGGIQNPELIWTATAGDISDTGVFTPPDQSQIVTITVALASHPDISDSIDLPVGGCSCSASISVGGQVVGTTSLRFFLSDDLGGVQAFDWRGDGPHQATFGFGSDPGNPGVVPLNSTGGFDGATSGGINGWFFFNPDPDDATLPPLSVTISENTGSLFAGSVTGMVKVLTSEDPDPLTVPLLFTFSMEADPILSSESVKMCEVTFQN